MKASVPPCSQHCHRQDACPCLGCRVSGLTSMRSSAGVSTPQTSRPNNRGPLYYVQGMQWVALCTPPVPGPNILSAAPSFSFRFISSSYSAALTQYSIRSSYILTSNPEPTTIPPASLTSTTQVNHTVEHWLSRLSHTTNHHNEYTLILNHNIFVSHTTSHNRHHADLPLPDHPRPLLYCGRPLLFPPSLFVVLPQLQDFLRLLHIVYQDGHQLGSAPSAVHCRPRDGEAEQWCRPRHARASPHCLLGWCRGAHGSSINHGNAGLVVAENATSTTAAGIISFPISSSYGNHSLGEPLAHLHTFRHLSGPRWESHSDLPFSCPFCSRPRDD